MTASSHIISAEQSDRARLSHHLYSLGKQFSLANGETCTLYKWVIFENPVQQKKSIGQVIEILQVVGSLEMQEKVPNFILVVIFEANTISATYGMPMLIEKEDKVLINYKVCF